MNQVVGAQLSDVLPHVLLAVGQLNAAATWDDLVDDGSSLC